MEDENASMRTALFTLFAYKIIPRWFIAIPINGSQSILYSKRKWHFNSLFYTKYWCFPSKHWQDVKNYSISIFQKFLWEWEIPSKIIFNNFIFKSIENERYLTSILQSLYENIILYLSNEQIFFQFVIWIIW